MYRNRYIRLACLLLVPAILTLGSPGPASAASRYRVLHNFECKADGCSLDSAVTFDSHGNLYGAASGGGSSKDCLTGCGTIFELKHPSRGGAWRLSVLHNMSYNDGVAPGYGGVTFDASGNIYGTTPDGGAYDFGTVFQLSPGSGGWALNVLHDLGNGNDGGESFAPVVLDKAGSLYGTTQNGAPRGGGVVFELRSGRNGQWTERVLHNFPQGIHDGGDPEAPLIWDGVGNLYSTTRFGGAVTQSCEGCGTVFELSLSGTGWKEHVLYRFKWVVGAKEGYAPYAPVMFDTKGNLYGTTAAGGPNSGCFDGCGTIFKLMPRAHGEWKETVLYTFRPSTGSSPYAGLVIDKSGNLYGTAAFYAQNDAGVVFELSPQSSGKWKYRVLHYFTGPDGAQPMAGLMFDKSGKHLYGTTHAGGQHNGGVIFEITP